MWCLPTFPSLKSDGVCLPVDDYDQTFTTPKIMTVTGGGQEDTFSNDAMSSSEHDLNIWEEDQSANEAADNTEPDEPAIKVKKELVSTFLIRLSHLEIYMGVAVFL